MAGRLVGAALVLSLGLRVLYLFVRYLLGWAGTERFHVETWALIFVAAGVALRLLQSRRSFHDPAGSTRFTTVPYWLWAVFCALACALYWPARSIGFLSDDFVLVTHATRWDIGPVTPVLFRPIPLLLWAFVLQAGGGATMLHLLNLFLHATNAYLTVRVVAGWVQDRRWSVLAGLVMLTAPLAPEAVAWLSGVFDLLATTLVLTCILISRRYGDRTPLTTRMQFLAAGLAAVASKETAAVAGALVLLDAWARERRPRQLLVDTGILIATVGVFGLTRLGAAFGIAGPPDIHYVLQRALFGAVGGLAVPWHADVIGRLPWLPLVGVLALLYLMLAFFLEREGSRQQSRLAMAAALFALIPVVPVFPILFVAPDLQQSRYLYMSAVGWAAVIVVAASRPRSDALHRVSLAAVSALIAVDAYGTLLHLGPWSEAALLRDRVEASAPLSGMDKCPTVILSNLPDSVRGAYVFRNGAPEAFARDLSLNAVVGDSAGPCSFRWSETRLSFVPFGTD